jgi:hypothetical protein
MRWRGVDRTSKSVFEPDSGGVQMPENPAHMEPVIDRSAQGAFKILEPDFDGLIAGSARRLPAHVVRALSTDLGPGMG